MIYWIAWILWNFIRNATFPLTVHGRENIPRQGAFILASNHLSNLDPMIIGGTFPRALSYMAKDSLFKNGIFRFFLGKVGAFPVKRDSPDKAALKEALNRLQQKIPLVVFPEGTRHLTQKQSHPGVAFLAVKSGVPVIPVFIKGSDRAMPPGSRFPRRAAVYVIFGKPRVYFKSMPYENTAKEILREIYALNPHR